VGEVMDGRRHELLKETFKEHVILIPPGAICAKISAHRTASMLLSRTWRTPYEVCMRSYGIV
jgi:hypothetical protein